MSVFDTIRSRISLPDYLQGVLELKKAGSEYKALCPFHNEDTPSFTVFESDGIWKWYCHGACKTGGDVIDFHTKKYNLTVVQSVKALADRYGVDISEWSDNRPVVMSSSMARNTMQEYFVKCLEANEDAKKYLNQRGVTTDMVKQWGLGYSDGRAYEYARDVLRKDDGTPNVQLIIEIGIAKTFDSTIGNAIGAGKITFPCKKHGAIGFWHLRSASKDKSREYQMVKESRPDGYLFFNQDRLDEKEFWLVEGPYDAMAIEKAGRPAVACIGTPNNDQIEFIKSLKVLDEHFPEKCESKTIHLCLDRDEGGAGQNAANKFVAEMAEYHKVYIHTLPVGEDIDDYLNSGKNLDDLDGKQHSKEIHKVIEAEGKFWSRSKDGANKPVSNFTMRRKFVFVDDDHNRTYKVHVTKEGKQSALVDFNSKDFSNLTGFREWLGFKGDYLFDGNQDDLTNTLKYLYDVDNPMQIKVKDNYGHCIPGVWLFENAIINKGKLTMADADGVIALPNGGYIKSKLSGNGEMPAQLPSEWYTPKDIIANFLKFYSSRREWVWKALGFATAMYYHNLIRNKYREFPIMACYGPSRRGKTAFATIVASLLGAGSVSNPSAKSTERGMERLIALLNSLPVVVNEYSTTDLGDLVRDIYDRNSNLRAIKTTDNRVHRSGINSTLITTSESVPSEASVQNRMILMDFDDFKKPTDKESQQGHSKWMIDGGQRGMNVGWLIALSAANGEETILEDIEYSRRQFIDQVGQSADSRTIYNYAVIFGAFRNACRVLDIPGILADLGAEPIDPELIYGTVIESSKSVEDLNNDCSPGKIFFTILEKLFIEDKAISCCRKVFDETDGKHYLKIHMSHAFSAVKESDNRGSKLLNRWTQRDVYNIIKDKFELKNGWLPRDEGKGTDRCIMIGVKDLESKWGQTFADMAHHE
jgi:DNA primase catalytic core